jgi:hypothetical protein
VEALDVPLPVPGRCDNPRFAQDGRFTFACLRISACPSSSTFASGQTFVVIWPEGQKKLQGNTKIDPEPPHGQGTPPLAHGSDHVSGLCRPVEMTARFQRPRIPTRVARGMEKSGGACADHLRVDGNIM